MSAKSDEWCLIESDPAVFTELLESLGCVGLELEELWSLDEDALQTLQETTHHIYGLIFLFQWNHPKKKSESNQNRQQLQSQQEQEQQEQEQQQQDAKRPLTEEEIPPDLFFAHQVTTNACATQALLSILLNADGLRPTTEETSSTSLSSTHIGKTLQDFASFTKSFSPHLKGVSISSSTELQQSHNRFALQPEAGLLLESNQRSASSSQQQGGEAFHFIAYVPHNGTVYELDGLQKGPIVIGTIPESEPHTNNNNSNNNNKPLPAWLALAKDAIQQRMQQQQQQQQMMTSASSSVPSDIKFNLMALIEDKRIYLRTKLEDATNNNNNNINNESIVQATQAKLQWEETKRAQWKLENQRRRHNYLPLCIRLLQEMARQGHLQEHVQAARDKQIARKHKQSNVPF